MHYMILMYAKFWSYPSERSACEHTSESNLFNFVWNFFWFPIWYAVCLLFFYMKWHNEIYSSLFLYQNACECVLILRSSSSSNSICSSGCWYFCILVCLQVYHPCFFACDSTMHSYSIIAFSISNWNLSWHYLNSNLMKESNGKLNRSLSL